MLHAQGCYTSKAIISLLLLPFLFFCPKYFSHFLSMPKVIYHNLRLHLPWSCVLLIYRSSWDILTEIGIRPTILLLILNHWYAYVIAYVYISGFISLNNNSLSHLIYLYILIGRSLASFLLKSSIWSFVNKNNVISCFIRKTLNPNLLIILLLCYSHKNVTHMIIYWLQ